MNTNPNGFFEIDPSYVWFTFIIIHVVSIHKFIIRLDPITTVTSDDLIECIRVICLLSCISKFSLEARYSCKFDRMLATVCYRVRPHSIGSLPVVLGSGRRSCLVAAPPMASTHALA